MFQNDLFLLLKVQTTNDLTSLSHAQADQSFIYPLHMLAVHLVSFPVSESEQMCRV